MNGFETPSSTKHQYPAAGLLSSIIIIDHFICWGNRLFHFSIIFYARFQFNSQSTIKITLRSHCSTVKCLHCEMNLNFVPFPWIFLLTTESMLLALLNDAITEKPTKKWKNNYPKWEFWFKSLTLVPSLRRICNWIFFIDHSHPVLSSGEFTQHVNVHKWKMFRTSFFVSKITEKEKVSNSITQIELYQSHYC